MNPGKEARLGEGYGTTGLSYNKIKAAHEKKECELVKKHESKGESLNLIEYPCSSSYSLNEITLLIDRKGKERGLLELLAMSKKFELLSFFLRLSNIHRRCSVGEFLG